MLVPFFRESLESSLQGFILDSKFCFHAFSLCVELLPKCCKLSVLLNRCSPQVLRVTGLQFIDLIVSGYNLRCVIFEFVFGILEHMLQVLYSNARAGRLSQQHLFLLRNEVFMLPNEAFEPFAVLGLLVDLIFQLVNQLLGFLRL